MTQPRTLLDKLWDAHEILRRDDGASLLWVDRHLVHEGSHHAFAKIGQKQIRVKEPNLTFGVLDHYVPTNRVGIQIDPSIPRMMQTLRDNAAMHGFKLFDLTHQNQGIVHVIGPELGLTLPGLLVNCGDSHTSTHGAFGALAFGIGATEVAHVLATQTIWQRKPRAMRIKVEGTLGPSVTAKDIALNWISLLGADGARGHAIEYAGSTIEALSMEGRMTLCNLSIEGGARFGMIAPDQTTFDYVKNRRYAPQGQKLEEAIEDWSDLKSDSDAYFDREITLRAEDIAPTVSWGTSPEQAVPVTATIPALENLEAPKAEAAKAALEYMGLEAGRQLIGTPVDQIFIGSCTNGRIEDLRAAAEVLQGRRAVIPGLISPGSLKIKAMAESEGLDKVFKDAGLEWAGAGCSMCVGMNGDLVAAGKRCASSTNRNFRGRQGKGARTHLMSPAMVAAAAVTGTICDVRDLLSGKTN
ncbi:MAG: 3-isopropylmalate dehydratase large subunit [Rhodobacteraceae bacterium]|jgi:3-isopropylmalate/(R)-2-methylmalate dehydratase large subunit|nr:3-isopropylmalate dehydratase large subunit [Paracoccaceae bacterium]NDI02920.1 3-isopropylmalate dehydratase large subunit [Paracoccaceae bacterium]